MSPTPEAAFAETQVAEVRTTQQGERYSAAEDTFDTPPHLQYTTEFEELREPHEVDGFVTSRVSEYEFDALKTEVGDNFFKQKGLKQSSRDRAAYTMLLELRRRGVPLVGYSPAHCAKKSPTDGAVLAEKFKMRGGRKSMRALMQMQ